MRQLLLRGVLSSRVGRVDEQGIRIAQSKVSSLKQLFVIVRLKVMQQLSGARAPQTFVPHDLAIVRHDRP